MDIIQMAEQLGKAISNSTQATDMRQARQTFGDQKDASLLLAEYQEQATKITQLERGKKPIEVDDKHRLDELQGKLIAIPAFKKLTEAEMEYIDLMRKVNTALGAQLQQTEQS